MTALFEGLTHWHWLGLGFVLLAIEVLGSVGFLLWTGIAALEVGLILLLFVFIGEGVRDAFDPRKTFAGRT